MSYLRELIVGLLRDALTGFFVKAWKKRRDRKSAPPSKRRRQKPRRKKRYE